jgi:hypothetical protein
MVASGARDVTTARSRTALPVPVTAVVLTCQPRCRSALTSENMSSVLLATPAAGSLWLDTAPLAAVG